MMPVFEECVGYADGRLEHAARVAAQIQDQATQRRRWTVADKLQQRRLQVARRRIAELRDAHVAVAAGQRFRAHAVHVHFASVAA